MMPEWNIHQSYPREPDVFTALVSRRSCFPMWVCHLTLLSSLLQDLCSAVCWVEPSLQKTWKYVILFLKYRKIWYNPKRKREWVINELIWFVCHFNPWGALYTFFSMCEITNNSSSAMCWFFSMWNHLLQKQSWTHLMLSKGEVQTLVSYDMHVWVYFFLP